MKAIFYSIKERNFHNSIKQKKVYGSISYFDKKTSNALLGAVMALALRS